MGFMAGFGSAFADSFKQQEQIQAQEKQDAVKMRFTDYMSRRDEQVKQDKENAKNMKAAEQLVNMSGQPAEVKFAVYDMKSAGMSDEMIMKQLEANTAIITPNTTAGDTSGPADPRDGLTEGAQTSVDAQMQQSGMTPPAPEQGIFGRIKGAMTGGSSQERDQRTSDRADQQIADATGQTPEAVQSTMKGQDVSGDPVPGRSDVSIKWQPKPSVLDVSKISTVGEALTYQFQVDQSGTETEKLQAADLVARHQHQKATEAAMAAQASGTGFTFSRGFIKDANGGWTGGVAIPQDDGRGGYIWRDAQGNQLDSAQVLPADKNMEADIKQISTEMGEPIKKYEASKTDFKALARTSAEISQLAKEHPEAMGASGDLSQYTDAFKRAAVNVAKIVNPKFDPGIERDQVDPGVFGELEKAERATNGMLKGVVDRNEQNALYATLMDIKATRLAYMWAKDMGQQGRGVSNADFNNFKNVAKGGGNPAALKQSAADFLAESRKNLQDQEQSLMGGGASGIYFEQKYPGVPNPFKISSTIDQEVQGDPQLQQAIDQVSDNSQPEGNQAPAGGTEVPTWLPKAVGSNGESITPQVYQNLSPRGKELLEKKFGGK